MPRSAPSPLRLFVAVHPPPETACALLDALRSCGPPPHRPVPAAQMHLTLQFVGDTPAKRLQEVIKSVERSCAGIGVFTLRPLRLIALPTTGAARLIAAETDAPPELLELHRRLAHRLARSVRERPGDRFLPHLTLCRFNSPGAAPQGLPAPLTVEPFPVRAVTLMRSVLLPDGAEHRAVSQVELLSDRSNEAPTGGG